MSRQDINMMADELRRSREVSSQSVQTIGGRPYLELVAYIEIKLNYEIARCTTLLDDTELRRAQGSVSALEDVLELIKHVPVMKRRTTSRIEV